MGNRGNGGSGLARLAHGHNARPGERNGIQSVDRAVTLLETIAEAGGEATLTEIAGRAGLNISTSHHLLSTLVHRGYVSKVPGKRSYALGGRIAYLNDACRREIELPQRAAPLMARITKTTGESVHLVALQREKMVTLARSGLTRPAPPPIAVMGGAHAKASGKAMLAWLPEHESRRIVTAHGMIRFTPNTITEWPVLNEQLRLVRRHSFSIDREEFQPGMVCVGSAIRDHKGAVVAALAASTSTSRATDEHVALMREEVIAAALTLSAELGGPALAPNAENP